MTFHRIILIVAIGSFACLAHSEVQSSYLQPVNADPRRIDLPFKADSLPVIEWQFSQDGGERWRPVLDKIGTVVTEEQTDKFWNRVTRLLFPGDFPAGMSFRVKFTSGPDQRQLTDEITLPHVTEFPEQERILENVDFDQFEVDKGLIVGSKFIESGNYSLKTFLKTGSGWQESVTLDPPEGDPEGSRFGQNYILRDYQLFVSHFVRDGGDSYDGQILIYDWMGPENGWVLNQTLSAAVLPQQETGALGVSLALQEGRLLAGYSGKLFEPIGPSSEKSIDGAVYLFERQESGNWSFVQRLAPVSDKPWRGAFRKPLFIDGVIITHGEIRNGFDNTFYFQKDTDGIWQCVLTEELPFLEAFKVGNRLVRTSLYSTIDDPSIGEGNTAFYVYSMEMNPGPTLLSTTIQKYGFFLTDVVDDWLVFAFEPSPELAVPGMAVALAPLFEDKIHPQPAILLPAEDGPTYTSVHTQDADGERIYVTSFLNDGTEVMDSFDISKVPHPKFPDVPFAKWSLVGFMPSPDLLPIQFREDTSGHFVTRVLYSFDRVTWIELLPMDYEKTIIDDNPDGDNRTQLVEILVPSKVDGKQVFYQLREEPTIPGS